MKRLRSKSGGAKTTSFKNRCVELEANTNENYEKIQNYITNNKPKKPKSKDINYFNIDEEDPETVEEAKATALNKYKNNLDNGYYDKHIENYRQLMSQSQIKRGLNPQNDRPAVIANNKPQDSNRLPITQKIPNKTVVEIFHKKCRYYDGKSFACVGFFESLKKKSLFNNILWKECSIVNNEINSAFRTLKYLGWDILYKQIDDTTDFIVEPLRQQDLNVLSCENDTMNETTTNELLFLCYHFTHYGESVAYSDISSSNNDNQRTKALLITCNQGDDNLSNINTKSEFDILLFVREQVIVHMCFIPNNLFLT